jgi:hypothetical protein
MLKHRMLLKLLLPMKEAAGRGRLGAVGLLKDAILMAEVIALVTRFSLQLFFP